MWPEAVRASRIWLDPVRIQGSGTGTTGFGEAYVPLVLPSARSAALVLVYEGISSPQDRPSVWFIADPGNSTTATPAPPPAFKAAPVASSALRQ